MNILAFIYSFPPYPGGSGLGMYDLLKRMAKLNDYKITVVTLNHGDAPAIDTLDDMRIYRLTRWELADIYPIPKPTVGNYRLLKSALREKPDIIYTRTRFFFTTLVGLIISIITRTPMLHTEPGSCYVKTGKWYLDWTARIWDMTIGRMVAKRAVCVGVCKESARMMQHLGARNVRIIYNGVDTTIFNFHIFPEELEQFTILYAGRLMWTKGMDILSDLADRLDGKVKVKAAGDGNYPMSNKIELLGQINPEELAKAMQNSSVLVLPSRMEGLSRVIQEAMACGLPVIATDVGGNKELVEHESTGFLCKVDAEDIEKAVLKLAEDKILRELMGANAYIASQNFDWTETVKKYKELIEEVVNEYKKN